MNDFKWRHFQGGIILWAVRWYCKYGISYRELEEMLLERGVDVDHSTIHRWVLYYAPLMQKRLKWHSLDGVKSSSWRVDETYIKIKGNWTYLYRVLDKFGNTIDFYLSASRDAKAATKFLRKAIIGCKKSIQPAVINTDKAKAYGVAISILKEKKICDKSTVHRQVKYLNNVIESDHGKLKRIINPILGFKSFRSAWATIKGIELMNSFRKGQLDFWCKPKGKLGHVRLINEQFGIYSV